MKKEARGGRTPRAGAPVRGSRTGRPIMALLDLLGRRWALRVVWELRGGPRRFRELQEGSGASPSVLNQRLAELKDAGVVALAEEGYALTGPGQELLEALLPLNTWAERWARAGDAQRPP